MNRPLWDDAPTPSWQRYANKTGPSPGSRAPSEFVDEYAPHVGAGLVKGVTAMATLPGSLQRGWDYGMNRLGEAAGVDMGAVRGHVREARRQVPHSQLPAYNDGLNGVERLIGPLPEPETTGQRIAGAVGEFASGGLSPGTWGQKFSNIAGATSFEHPQRLRSTLASAADPMQLPSSIVGLGYPRARDAWRAESQADTQGHIVGGLMGGMGLFRAIPAASTRNRAIMTGAGVGVAPDVFDSVADGNNYIDLDPRNMGSTAQNAILGGMLHPMKPIPRR